MRDLKKMVMQRLRKMNKEKRKAENRQTINVPAGGRINHHE
jgi:hypothetical protein